MTFVFRDAPDAFATAASRVASATGIPMAHVEKDFWVTVAALSETPVDVLEREVVTFTEAAELQTSRCPASGFSTSAAFGPAAAQSARSAFETIVLAQLVWPDAPRPTLEECCETVHRQASVL